MKIRILLTSDATGGGGLSGFEFSEMYALARRHSQQALLDKALAESWTLDRFRKNLLSTIATGPIEGQPLPSGGSRSEASIGDRMITNEGFRNLLNTPKRGRSFSLVMDDLRGFGDMRQRATLLTAGLTSYQRPSGIVEIGLQPLNIADLFSQAETSAPTVRVMVETAYNNAATPVAEEGEKPEATFALEEQDFPVKKLAVIGRITNEMLEDFPSVRDYINSRLARMVLEKENSLLLNGSGSGEEIRGVLNTSGIQTEAYAGNGFDSINRGIQKVQTVGFFEADAVVMHPADFGNFRRTKDQEGRYYYANPADRVSEHGTFKVQGFMWNLPVVVSTFIEQGTALVGAFRLGGQIFRRMGLRIDASDSDGSDFKFNRIAIRAEERFALAVYRPLAFCKITGIPAV